MVHPDQFWRLCGYSVGYDLFVLGDSMSTIHGDAVRLHISTIRAPVVQRVTLSLPTHVRTKNKGRL